MLSCDTDLHLFFHLFGGLLPAEFPFNTLLSRLYLIYFYVLIVLLINFFIDLFQNREEMAQFFQEVIDEHKRTFEPSHLRDLLDTYLYEIQKATEEGVGHHLFEGKDHGKAI